MLRHSRRLSQNPARREWPANRPASFPPGIELNPGCEEIPEASSHARAARTGQESECGNAGIPTFRPWPSWPVFERRSNTIKTLSLNIRSSTFSSTPPAFDSSYRPATQATEALWDDLSVQALRHSHASHLLRSGVEAKVISERLGRSKARFTVDQYVHLLPGMQEEAASKADAVPKAAREQAQSSKHVS